MRTDWSFAFHAHDFRFAKVAHFVATIRSSEDVPDPLAGMELQVRIEPDLERPHSRRDVQTGKLTISIPLPPEEAEDVVYAAAHNFGEQIAFRHGDFRVSYGFVTCKRIPETTEENAAIDDKPYTVKLQLEEVVAPPLFDGSRLRAHGGDGLSLELQSQFNDAKRSESPIQKFLGYFRVLESLSYASGSRKPLKRALAEYGLLRLNYNDVAAGGQFEQFVEQLVETRHRCAHLKSESGFGYTPSDPEVRSSLVPQLQLVEELAYRCIEGYTPPAA
jgi:hypothetical protein